MNKLAKIHQRFLFLLRNQEIVGKDEAIKISKELNELLYIDLPETVAQKKEHRKKTLYGRFVQPLNTKIPSNTLKFL